jgi:hypothetical protein
MIAMVQSWAREKSSPGANPLRARRDNRAFSENICRSQENQSLMKNGFLGVKLYEKNRMVCLMGGI